MFKKFWNALNLRVYGPIVRSLSLLLATTAFLACESTTRPVETYEHHVTVEMVTGAALAALRSDGRFDFEQPSIATGQVSLDEARAQAPQFARYVTNQILLRGVVEGERGGYWTDPHLLTVCRGAYFVHPQLGPLGADSVSIAAAHSFQRRFGPQWLVPMCGSDDDPQMTVQVAVDSNSIRFSDGAPIEPYASLSTAWYARGVPLNWPDPLPISAERAVRFAWETFGVRVTEVPQLFFRGDVGTDGLYTWYQIGSTRFCNRWRVVLESDVSMRGTISQATSTTRAIYVASLSCSQRDVEPTLHIPLTQQPLVATLDYFDSSVTPAKTWIVEVPVIAPIRFEIGSRGF